MAAVALKEGQIFVKRKHELADLLKQLDKVTPDAVELIAETMNDENQTTKTRLECAKALIDYKVRVTDQINKDDLTRQIAEIRATGLKTPLVPDDTRKPAAPRLDMNNIQSV